MNIHLQKMWDELRASYWFIPSLMTLGAIVLSFLLTALDAIIGTAWMEHIDWMYANQPEGARQLLSTIAGSMITVAGVVFSITIVALAHASSQFGPRLLTNFMQDRGNQITLGTFIATFIYCLLVLRTIHSPGDEATGMAAEVFVPQIAILGGMAMALASIGVLIFFLHHIPESIHASNVIANIGRELNDLIEETYPARVGKGLPANHPKPLDEVLPENFHAESRRVPAGSSGYLQRVDETRLVRLAMEHDLLLKTERRTGEFVNEGQALVQAWPGNKVNDRLRVRIERSFVWGRQRTQDQDLLFLVNELVEIASRALSTGMNDPFTAMTCMDWIGSSLIKLTGRNLAGPYRYDDERNLRMVMPLLTYNDYAEAAFEPLRAYAQKDRNAALRMMRMLVEVTQHAPSEELRKLLLQYAENLKIGCEEHLAHEADVKAVVYRYRQVVRMVQNPEDQRVLTSARGSRLTPSGAADEQ